MSCKISTKVLNHTFRENFVEERYVVYPMTWEIFDFFDFHTEDFSCRKIVFPFSGTEISLTSFYGLPHDERSHSCHHKKFMPKNYQLHGLVAQKILVFQCGLCYHITYNCIGESKSCF